tara:strand:+ start:623 stop:1882 length:1260 start_codon:yes stop_codon:yes gene_type:complete
MIISFFTHCLPSRNSHGGAETCYSLIKYFNSQNHKIILNIVGDENEYDLSHNMNAEIRQYCEKVNIYKIPKRKNLIKSFFRNPLNFFFPRKNMIFPSFDLENNVQNDLNQDKPDSIFIYHWIAAAPVMVSKIPKLLITGDLVHMPFETRMIHYKKLGLKNDFNINYIIKFFGVFWLGYHLRKFMVNILNSANDGGSFGWHDAEWLKKNGAIKSKYFKTSLIDTNPNFDIKNFDFSNTKKFKIITALSNLGSTSTLSGMVFLFEEVLENLKKTIGSENFEIHVIGKGNLPESLKVFEKDENIIMRGYVEDINHEFNTADVVLIPTAVFLGFRCRILNAFAQGACTIIHHNDAINQPEIINKVNCLVGRDGKEVSDLVYEAYTNPELRKKIRNKARELYINNFSPEISTPKILEKLTNITF